MRLPSTASLFFFLGGFLTTFAALPDAGRILRDQQPPERPDQRLPRPPARATTEATPGTGATVLVKQVIFRGHDGLASEAELRALARPVEGLPAGIGELQALAANITELLKQKGFFLARAYLPRQDVTDGVVEVAIIQATLDRTVEVDTGSARISAGLLRDMAEGAVRPGEPVNERNLERVLLLMNELPGVVAKAVLEPGATPGTTRLVFKVDEARIFSGALWADNYGNRYTGSWRGNGLLSITDPFGWGDEGTILVSGAEGLAQARLSYSLPLGSGGLRGNLAYTAMRYELVGDLEALDGKGDAQTVNAWLSYPLIRRRTLSLTATIGYDFKALTDELFGFTIRDKRVHAGNAGIAGSLADPWMGGGYNAWSLVATAGHLDLSGVKADERIDRLTSGAAGGFHRLNLAASRLQRITDSLAGFVSYSAQFASGNLDSSEKMSLGGPYAVRAYPVGEASGDEAHLLTIEARQDLPFEWKAGTLQVSAFLDTGRVTLNKNPWPFAVQTLSGKNEYWLSGAGVGASLTREGRYFLRINYAHRIGDNDGRSLQGKDADGRDASGRVWVIGQVSF